MDVDVISVLGPDEADVASFMADLLASAGKSVRRILLVDDGCREQVAESLRHAAASDSRIDVIQMPRHLGRLRASNLALERTTAPVVLFIDADAPVGPEWIDGVEGCFASSADAGVAATGSPESLTESFFGVSRRALDLLDGFDPVFGAGGGERVDFAMRAQYEGLTCTALEFSAGGTTDVRDDWPTRPGLSEANREILAARWPSL